MTRCTVILATCDHLKIKMSAKINIISPGGQFLCQFWIVFAQRKTQNEKGNKELQAMLSPVINIQRASPMNPLGPVACNAALCGSELTTNTDHG